MPKKILIAGQGIAGSCAAWLALQKGWEVTVFDQGALEGASAVSSGILNPITGRHFVKSWMSDDFIKSAKELYLSISEEYQEQFLHQIPMRRHISTVEIENIWSTKTITPGYEHHMESGPPKAEMSAYFNEVNTFGTVLTCARVDTLRMLTKLRQSWTEEGILRDELLDGNQLQYSMSGIEYQGEHYDAGIMAIGWKGSTDVVFPTDRYKIAKGEVLLCRIPDMPTSFISKFHKFIVPQGDDMFWIGTTWQWEFEHQNSESHKSQELVAFLDQYLKLDYEIVERKAGIRPVTKYRRPFIGSRNSSPRLFLLNGLGTTGVTMAPYWASEIINHIDKGDISKGIAYTHEFGRTFME